MHSFNEVMELWEDGNTENSNKVGTPNLIQSENCESVSTVSNIFVSSQYCKVTLKFGHLPSRCQRKWGIPAEDIPKCHDWHRSIMNNRVGWITNEYRSLIGHEYRYLINCAYSVARLIKTHRNSWTWNTLGFPHCSLCPRSTKTYKNHWVTLPIVSGRGCLTEMDSQLIDDYLHPHQSIIILG